MQQHTHKYRLSRLNELEEEARELRRVSIERLSEQERAPPLCLVVWRESAGDKHTPIKTSLSRYREEWKEEVSLSRKKSEELVNALKANGDDIRSCRDAKASISSLIVTLKRAVKRVSQLVGEGREKQKRMDADVKSASVVVTCMEAAKETEQVGNEFHHRRGSSSSHSSFGSTNSSNSTPSISHKHRRTTSPHFVLTGTGMMMAVPRRTTPPRVRSRDSTRDGTVRTLFPSSSLGEEKRDKEEEKEEDGVKTQQLLRLPIKEPHEGALLLAAREARDKALEKSKDTKKELQSIEALHGDLELMLESATSFLNDNDRSMMKIAESTRRIPEDVQQWAKLLLQYAEEGCKWQQVSSLMNEAWCAAEDERRLRIKKLATIRRLVVSSTSELHSNVEAMENRKLQCKAGMEKASLWLTRTEERSKRTKIILNETISTRDIMKHRLEASLKRKQLHEECGPLHLRCSTRDPLCQAELEWKEFQIKKSEHERCIKSAHEDEAAHKLETQSLARRGESRQEAKDWLENLPIVSIQRSKSEIAFNEKDEKKNGDQEYDHDDNLKMISMFHDEMKLFRSSLEKERVSDEALSEILKKQALHVKDLKPIFSKTTQELVNASMCRKSEMNALQSDWELQEQRRASLRSFVR